MRFVEASASENLYQPANPTDSLLRAPIHAA
jgi:hypothetical protein